MISLNFHQKYLLVVKWKIKNINLQSIGSRISIKLSLDLCVLCSSYGEGFPNVLGEAMASGIRCVATESGDTAEVIGGTGLVVPVRRPDLLAKAIIEVLNNPPEESPRERVMRKFSVGTLIKTTEEALLRLCSEQI